MQLNIFFFSSISGAVTGNKKEIPAMTPYSIGIMRGRRMIKWAATVAFLVFMTSIFLFTSSSPSIHKLKMTEQVAKSTKMMVTPSHSSTTMLPSTTSVKPTRASIRTRSSRRLTKRIRNSKLKAASLQRNKYIGKTSGWSVLPGGIVVHLGVVNSPHNYSYVVEEKGICKDFDAKMTKLLIIVATQDSDFGYRRVIRQTWGLKLLQQSMNFRVVFLLGTSGNKSVADEIQKESLIHGDIIQEDFDESWENLGKKTVMGLMWALRWCSEADYVMKTDQDVVIHVPNLLAEIARIIGKRKKDSELLLCHQNRVLKILRAEDVGNGREKYHVPDTIPGTSYPKYCAGLGYVMSRAVVKRLYQASLITPDFFIEDVFITGICRQKANVKLTLSPQIRINPPVLPGQGVCAFNEGRITSSELAISEIQILWEGINTKGFFCPQLIDKPVPKDFI